jgi:hypothetical protein
MYLRDRLEVMRALSSAEEYTFRLISVERKAVEAEL